MKQKATPAKLFLLVLVTLLVPACTHSKPSQVLFELSPGVFSPLEEMDPGSAKAWTDADLALSADGVTPGLDVQLANLDHLLSAEAGSKDPLSPGIRYRLPQALALGADRAIRFSVQTRSPILRCELFAADGNSLIATYWVYPPVALWPEGNWTMELRLFSGAVIGGFRISPVLAGSSLTVRSAGTSIPATSIHLDQNALVLPAGVRILGSDGAFLVSWERWPDAGSQPGLAGLRVEYAADPAASTDDVHAKIHLAGKSGSGTRAQDFTVRIRPGKQTLNWYPDSLGFTPFSLMITENQTSAKIRDISFFKLAPKLPSTQSPTPIPGDLWTMLGYRQSTWRDPRFEVFSWNLFPDILMIDFGSTDIQARFLKRLIFFTEKKGYRGSLQPDSVIENKHGWNANDFRSESLAAFFTKVQESGFSINPDEAELLRLVIDWGLIKREGTGYLPVKGGFVSVARGQGMPASTRSLLLQHECIHGIFFANEDFRSACRDVFQALSAPSREFITDYFSFYQYDPSDTYLMVNEFGAYLLQQSLSGLSGFITGTMVNNYVKVHPAEREAFSARAQAADHELVTAARELATRLWKITGISPAKLACLIPD